VEGIVSQRGVLRVWNKGMMQDARRKTNPKSEARNPKQIQNPNLKCSKPWLTVILFFSWNFGHLDLFGI
jgi:hypothetical protein